MTANPDGVRLLALADPADVWDSYCAEVPTKMRSLQGALAFGFDAALRAAPVPQRDGEVERLEFELKAARNELEIADGEIDRLKLLDPTEKRIEFLRLLKLVQKDGEKPGDTILRAFHVLYAAPPSRLDAEASDVRQEPDVVSQHLAWLNLYVGEMKPTNWRDMKDRMQSQLEQLSLAINTPPALPAGEEVRRATIEECAKIADEHKGKAASDPKRIRNMKDASEEAKIEIYAEERGEDIASEIIARSIRALSPSSNGKPATENEG